MDGEGWGGELGFAQYVRGVLFFGGRVAYEISLFGRVYFVGIVL